MANLLKATYDSDDNGRFDLTAGGTNVATAADARTALSLVVGTNVQAWDADLDSFGGLTGTGWAVRTGSTTYALRSITAVDTDISVTNPSAIAGNTTIDVGATVGKLDTNNTVTGNKTHSGVVGVDSITERTTDSGVGADDVTFLDSFLQLAEQAAPSTPAANKLRMYAGTYEGRSALFSRDENDLDLIMGQSADDILANVYLRPFGSVFPSGGSGGSFFVFDGTMNGYNYTGSDTLTGDVDSFGRYNNHAYAAAGTTAFSLYHAPAGQRVTQYNANGRVIIAFRINTFTTFRFFAGLCSVSGSSGLNSMIDSDTMNAASVIGINYSNALGHTALQFIYGRSGDTLTRVSTGTAVDGKFYLLAISVISTTNVKMTLYDEDGTEISSTTFTGNDILSSTDLYFGAGLNPSAAATTTSWDFFGALCTSSGVTFPFLPL